MLRGESGKVIGHGGYWHWARYRNDFDGATRSDLSRAENEKTRSNELNRAAKRSGFNELLGLNVYEA